MGGVTASIVGGSGYTGGELLRLLLGHPEVAIGQITSERRAGKRVTGTHPNLRKRTDATFVSAEALEPCDVLFLCLPHGAAGARIDTFLALAPLVIDLSADFRLNAPDGYATYYGGAHPRPDLLATFVYGIPELHREEMREARAISSAGCLATPTILGLAPLFRAGLVDPAAPAIVEVKTGSSGSGAEEGPASHHPERSGAMRSFKPTGHRHTAEIEQELTVGGIRPTVSFSATAIEAVRGVLATCHVFLREALTDRDLWRVYRATYGNEPFIRLVKESGGIYRYPEPKILTGSNFCDIGWEVDAHSRRVVVVGAVDNLMKGAAGQAVQAMNLRLGYDETLGLEFSGLHPI